MPPKKNPTQPTGEMELGGETYTLFWSYEAVADAEELTGLPLILGLTQRDIAAPRVSLVCAMLYACLKPRHPKLTLGEVKRLVNVHNIRDVWARVLEVWVAGMREQEEAAGDPPMSQG